MKKHLLPLLVLLTFSALLPPTRSSGSLPDDEIDQLIGRIERNLATINAEIGKRGQRLSPVFVGNIKANEEIFIERKEEKKKFELSSDNSADKKNYVAELKILDIDLSGAASFLLAAPLADDGVTDVRFETEFKYRPNNGWLVCWVSYGRSMRRTSFCPRNGYSTPVPGLKFPAQQLASGCKYVVTIKDPQFPLIELNMFIPPGFVEVPPSDTIYPIKIPVPYKIRK